MKIKEGTVFIIGRPNVGKSTFVNNLIGQKVAITSPKPQTTRFPIFAQYEDERGKITFIDTPGVIGRPEDLLSKKINQHTYDTFEKQIDVALYMVDPTRRRDFEEGKVLGKVRKLDKPKILVYNKADAEQTYLPQYKFLESEFPEVFHISAINRNHFKSLLDRIFELLPATAPVEERSGKTGAVAKLVYPALNIDSRVFLSELIREKIFLQMGDELPYTATVVVDDVEERKNGITYIKASIFTTNDRYKKMIIGKGGRKIKVIGSMARKEIELAINKKIFLDLTVETDPHWQETFYS